jgi:hypothetical protein
MTKTEQSPHTEKPDRNRRLVWAVAAGVAVLAVVACSSPASDEPDPVVEPSPTTTASEPTPTTAAPDLQKAKDLETIEAAVAAFYSGDGEKAAELFELADRTDD